MAGRLVLAHACLAALSASAGAEPMPQAVSLLDEQSSPDFVDADENANAPKAPLPPDTDRNQLRVELGIGAPAGLMAVRYSRVLSTRTRIEPAVGLGYTGVLGSLVVTQPLFESVQHTRGGTPYGASFELYAGYSASYLADGLRHPWTGRERMIPNGAYHWIDLGVSTQLRWRSLRITVGGGVTKLLAGPDDVGGPDHDDADSIWFFVPEGWFQRVGLAPSLWSSVGYAF